jgi:2-keto-4-pentenoate hydratase
MENNLITHLGDELYQALITREVLDPLTNRYADITIENAYRIQQRMIERRVQAGETIIGKKIGVTSQAVMNMLGVYQPDFGYLLDGMIYNEGEAIDIHTLIQPKAEGEIAFLLKKDLMGPGVSNADVLAATECVIPASGTGKSGFRTRWRTTHRAACSCSATGRSIRARSTCRCAAWCWKGMATSSRPVPAPPRSAHRSTPLPGWPIPWAGSAFR